MSSNLRFSQNCKFQLIDVVSRTGSTYLPEHMSSSPVFSGVCVVQSWDNMSISGQQLFQWDDMSISEQQLF
jgi:hypothetical protein